MAWLKAVLWTRATSRLLALSLSACLAVGGLGSLLGAPASAAPGIPLALDGQPVIPMEEQPFYSALQSVEMRLGNTYLGDIASSTPQSTLLRFYVAMARVNAIVSAIKEEAESQPGLLWSGESRRKIQEAERLFSNALLAIDASQIPASIRQGVLEESAFKLKQILDYVFHHSDLPINPPNNNTKASWELPATAISLVQQPDATGSSKDYRFSAETVNQIDRMYAALEQAGALEKPNHQTVSASLLTPDLYQHFTYTLGYLVPPKVYLKLPQTWRNILETPVGEQSFLQIFLTALIFAVGIPVSLLLLLVLAQSYQRSPTRLRRWPQSFWSQTNLEAKAWKRFILVLPILLLTITAHHLIDREINLTGHSLRNIEAFFSTIQYVSIGVLVIFLFEALGRSGAHWIHSFRGGNSAIEQRRLTNVAVPISRVLGAIAATALFYQLLLKLGLPPTAVIAFSAVPGLAIGLGASKLLGNLFAGIAIQSDKPVRVGEFCSIGSDQGFVSRIGLRSMDLITLSGRVTIPNSRADEERIINYSPRNNLSNNAVSQGLELQLQLPGGLMVLQLKDLVKRTSDYLASREEISRHDVSFHETNTGQSELTIFVNFEAEDWKTYLRIRQSILADVKLILAIVNNCARTIRVAYGTSKDKLDLVPHLLREAVNADPELNTEFCWLINFAEQSINFILAYSTQQTDVGKFLDAVDALHGRILKSLNSAQIELALPIQTIQLKDKGLIEQQQIKPVNQRNQ